MKSLAVREGILERHLESTEFFLDVQRKKYWPDSMADRRGHPSVNKTQVKVRLLVSGETRCLGVVPALRHLCSQPRPANQGLGPYVLVQRLGTV
jgi:hypothetical protein